MRNYDYVKMPEKLLTPEIVQMIASIHEHKGRQELFIEANVDELKTLLEVALIQSTGASNRIEGIYTTDRRLEELVSQKAEPRNRIRRKVQVEILRILIMLLQKRMLMVIKRLDSFRCQLFRLPKQWMNYVQDF